MRSRNRSIGIAAGLTLAVTVAPYALGTEDARAARSRSRLKVISVNVEDLDDVALNQLIEIRFNSRITKSTLERGAIAIRPVIDGVALGEPRPGTWTRRRNVVRFLPALPTHAADPNDPAGGFYAPGTPNDDAFVFGGLRPGTTYRVVLSGRDARPAVKSHTRGRLRRTVTSEFQTAGGLTEAPLFLAEEWTVDPPPRVMFTNPPDSVIEASDAYRSVTGTHGVPIAADVTVFGSGIPFDPIALREPGAVELIRVAPLVGDEAPVTIAGDVVVDQDRNGGNFTFRPSVRLEEETTYALRIARSVGDLTGVFAIADHAERERLRQMHEFLASAHAFAPEVPVEQLPDPPAELTFDWPQNAAERGELKRNLLAAGDAHPWAIDPRVFAVFTTRDEPVTRTQGAQGPGKRSSRRSGSLPQIARIVTPLGLQGRAGGRRGGNVVIPFTLTDRRGRAAAVEAQFGFDRNDDGIVADDEFRPLTQDRRDQRTLGYERIKSHKPAWGFRSAPGRGRSNALVWLASADAPSLVERTIDFLYRETGRRIPDPNDVGEFLFDEAGSGVVVRLRTTRGKRRPGRWVYSRPFDFSNARPPALSIDGVTTGTNTLVAWTAIDPDGEDLNGNGVLDPLDLEDVNGNGVLDHAVVAVAFDHVVVPHGTDLTEATYAELATLDWQPCSRAAGVGDPDVGRNAAPLGYAYTFAWDHASDGLSAGDRVLVRARPFDESRTQGRWVYRAEAVTIGE